LTSFKKFRNSEFDMIKTEMRKRKWKQLNFCGSGSTWKKEAESGSKLGTINFLRAGSGNIFHKTWGRDVEAEAGSCGSG